MTFSYDEDLEDDVSKVRDLIQDIDEDYPLLSDESIQATIDLTPSNLIGNRFWRIYGKNHIS